MQVNYYSYLKTLLGKKRTLLVDSNIISTRLMILAMPMLGLVIQCLLFLFGHNCSPFPIWISFFCLSLLAFFLHWRCLLKFWVLIGLGLFLTAFTFSYSDYDSEVYHIPMQLLLREGWNPIFDSTIEKFNDIVDASSLSVHHTLFLPKTSALCGALVSQATGLWIADSFLGYMLLFSLLNTSYLFAQRIWNCHRFASLIFAIMITFTTKVTTMLCGQVDYAMYASLLIALLSLALYSLDFKTHDYILAILASVICCTIKTTGLVSCALLWGIFALCYCNRKETYIGILSMALLVILVGMAPLATAWIQYGSPFYPSMTFNPKITPVDITGDFTANADGEKMGYVARIVYAWVSPRLASKACSIYYHQSNFNPVFNVLHGVNGLGTFLNLILCGSILLLILAPKNIVSWICLFILISANFSPLKYIGYARYFPQVWAVIPLGFYQFINHKPSWLGKISRFHHCIDYTLYFILISLSLSSMLKICTYQAGSMIIEGHRQQLLSQIKSDNTIFLLPANTRRGYTLSRRLASEHINFEISQLKMDMEHFEEDTLFPCFKNYYMTTWKCNKEYAVGNGVSSIMRFKWTHIFKYFPHPVLY